MKNKWILVVCIGDCTENEDGDFICPQCGYEFGDCPCPGPTMDEYEYKEEGGKLWARKLIGCKEQKVGVGDTAEPVLKLSGEMILIKSEDEGKLLTGPF